MKEDKPSQTAALLAKELLYLERTKQISNYLEPKAIELYKECIQLVDKPWLENLNKPLYRKAVGWVERIILPGICIHTFLRKQIIKRWMLEALAENTEQVVVLAAGFDALVTTFYSQYPQVKFIEIDHPATQKVKKSAFYRFNFDPKNVHFLSADLSKQSLTEVLKNSPVVNPQLKTFFIVEGLTMYLTQQENLILFKEIGNYFNSDLLLAFTFMKIQSDGGIHFKETSFFAKAWLRYQEEIFKWGCALEELAPTFLNQVNLQLVELISPKNEASLYKGIFSKEKIAEGEYLCLAKQLS